MTIRDTSEMTPRPNLTPFEVWTIRKRHTAGDSIPQIAGDYKRDPATIKNIIDRKTHKAKPHIPPVQGDILDELIAIGDSDTRMTPKDKARIKQAHREGVPVKKIAFFTKRTRTTIYNVVRAR